MMRISLYRLHIIVQYLFMYLTLHFLSVLPILAVPSETENYVMN